MINNIKTKPCSLNSGLACGMFLLVGEWVLKFQTNNYVVCDTFHFIL